VSQLRAGACGEAGLGIAPFAIPDWPEAGDGTSLVARALVLDDGLRALRATGQVRLGLVSLTALALCRAEADRVRESAAAAMQLPPANLLVAISACLAELAARP